MNPVTVLIPIGPQKEYLQWLPEAIESVLQQTYSVDEIFLVLDGHAIDIEEIISSLGREDEWVGIIGDGISRHIVDDQYEINAWSTPWTIGFAQAFNCGVGLVRNNLIIYLASDDKLLPTAVEDCVRTWEENNQKDAWYAMSYQVGEDVHTIPNNAAMITRNLFRWLKGYPPSAFAGPDALLLSVLLRHAPDRIIKVTEGKANYWVRQHPYQDTLRQFSFFAASGIMEVIRNMETERFVPNTEVTLK